MFKDFNTLQMFIELRVKYLLQIISSLFQVAPIVLADVTDVDHIKFLKELSKLIEGENDIMATLGAFDSLLSSNDWGSRWATQLRTSKCLQDLMASTATALRITTTKDSGTDLDDQRAAAIEFLRRAKRARDQSDQKESCDSSKKVEPKTKDQAATASGQSWVKVNTHTHNLHQ